jgi:uncharacterized membrane-anchored protein YhcB (DUF1043 family)
MSQGHRTRKIVARIIVALLLGIAMGYAIGTSLASDAARGRALTMKDYVANFDTYKAKLESGSPMAAMILAGVFLALVMFALYELLVWGVDRLLAALDRRRVSADQPGTPPPW